MAIMGISDLKRHPLTSRPAPTSMLTMRSSASFLHTFKLGHYTMLNRLVCVVALISHTSFASADVTIGLLSDALRKHHSVMLLIDPPSGKILDANEAAERLYGHSLGALRTMGIADFNMLQPDEIAAERARAAREERNYFIFPHRVADGSVRTVEVYSSPVKLAGGQEALLSVVLDATGKNLAEDELLQYKTQLEELVRQRTDEVIASKAARDRVLMIAISTQAVVILVLLIVLSSRKRLLHHNRQAMAQVEAASRYARGLLEATLDPLVTIDRDGRISDVNNATELATGENRQTLIGRDFCTLFTEPDKARIGYQTVFANGQVRDYPLVIKHRDGRLTEVVYNATLYRSEEGEIAGAFAAARDVTAFNRAQTRLLDYQSQLEQRVEERTRQLGAAREQLLHAEKLSAIGQLAAGVAHEINNPLGFVSSNLNTLRKYFDSLAEALDLCSTFIRSPANDHHDLLQRLQDLDIDFLQQDGKELLEESGEGITRIRRIVQDLKDFSHQDQTPSFAQVDLHACLESSLNMARNEIKYKAEVIREYGPIPAVECVASQIGQVFLNLLVNAAQAIETEPGQITVRTGTLGDQVWVEIGDNGSGIAEAVKARVFEPFFTTKPVGKGTGLGLSVSFGIITQHRGQITVDSQPGEWTRFTVWLPVRQPVQVALASGQTSAAATPTDADQLDV